MKKIIKLCALWLCGGFLSALLKDLKVNNEFIYGLHFCIGYFSCLIMYWKGARTCLEAKVNEEKKKSSTQKN